MKTEKINERVLLLIRDFVALNVLELSESQSRCEEEYKAHETNYCSIDYWRSKQRCAALKIIEAMELEDACLDETKPNRYDVFF